MLNKCMNDVPQTELCSYLDFLRKKDVSHDFVMWKLLDCTCIEHKINDTTVILKFNTVGKLCNAEFDNVEVTLLKYNAIVYCIGNLLDFVPKDRRGYDGNKFSQKS